MTLTKGDRKMRKTILVVAAVLVFGLVGCQSNTQQKVMVDGHTYIKFNKYVYVSGFSEARDQQNVIHDPSCQKCKQENK